MAIVLSVIHVNSGKGVTSLSTISPTIAVGDYCIVVAVGDTPITAAIVNNAGSGGADLTLVEDVTVDNSGNAAVSIWSAKALAATAAGFATISNSNEDAKAIAYYKATGLDETSPFDKSATGTGSGTAASAGPTATLSQADELVIGGVAAEDEIDDQTGTWTTGAAQVDGNEQATGTNGAGDASNISIYAAAKVVAATTAMNADVTGMDSIDWAVAIATYKGAAVAGASFVLPHPSYRNVLLRR